MAGERLKPIMEDDDSEDDKILKEAKENFKRWQDWESDFRWRYINDVKFANADSDNGWQWPDDLRADREANKRPALTLNKVQRLVAMITNDARQNKPSITIKPTGNESSYKSAQVYEGLVRDIEYKSAAQSIYDECTDSQVEGGIAYFRVNQVYTDDDSFDQELRIEPVRDHLGVFLDCDIKQKDGSDAMWGGVFDDMPKAEFEKLNPDLDMAQIGQTTIFDEGDTWLKEDSIRIAEYYRIVQTEDELYWVEDDKGDSSTFKASEAPKGFKKSLVVGKFKKRKIINRQLEWYKIAGHQIIDRRKLKGRYIPIVRVVGVERVIDGKLERKGFVRPIKDAQRMYNYNAPLALTTPIPTPNGWTNMGALNPGDWVLAPDGKPVQVVGISPVFLHRACYKITFDNGCSITADAAHKWAVEERGKRRSNTWEWSNKVITTAEISPKRHFIYSTKPVDLPDVELPVHPYVLGAWLGDGRSAGTSITSGFADMHEMKLNLSACGYNVSEPRIYGDKTAGEITIYGIRRKLIALGVLNNKHVPEMYLRASVSQRLSLLQGLMDTDGCIAKNMQCVFTNGNAAITDAVIEILHSLGIRTTRELIKASARMFPGGQTRECEEYYRTSFTAYPDMEMFRLSRKLKNQTKTRNTHTRRTKRHGIVSVVEVPSVPVKCISVNSESHLFLAGEGWVPTHNSGEIESGALQTKTPWVGAAAAFEGNETAWSNANTQNAAYLTFKHLDSEGQPLPSQALPQRLQPPQSVPAFIQGMQIADAQMSMVGGQENSTLGKEGQEKSGIAIQQRQRQGDLATYLFVNNLALAIRYAGRIIIDLVPHIYDTKRVIQILGKDGTQSKVTVDPNADDAYQEVKEADIVNVLFNPSVGKYEVESDIGPAYATQRQEAWNAFVQIVTGAPALIDEIGDLMFRSADFPLADKIAERLRRKIQANAPYLLEDGAANPQTAQLQQALQAAQGQVGELIQKLAEKNLELKNRDDENAIRRNEADSKRLTAETNSIVDMAKMGRELKELQMAILQTLRDMGSDSLANVPDTNNSTDPSDTDGSSPLVEGNAIPPFQDAVKDQQGAWTSGQ